MRRLIIPALTLAASLATGGDAVADFGVYMLKTDAGDATAAADAAHAAAQLGSGLRRTLPADNDPYAALGIRAGAFVLHPTLDTTVGYSSNAAGTAGGTGAASVTVTPALTIESDWSRHAASLMLRGSYDKMFDDTVGQSLSASAAAAARLDFHDSWTGNLAATYDYSQQSVSDPDTPSGLDSRPGIHAFGATAGIAGGAGRLRVSLDGSVTRTVYENGFSGGSVVDQGDRTNTLAAARLRLGYRTGGALTPFVEGEAARRIYDREVDTNGLRRASTGYALRAGVEFDRGPVLTGELAAGVETVDFDDATLGGLSAFTFNGSLVWAPTELTTVTASAATTFAPSASATSSGSITHGGDVTLSYAWKPNLTLNWTGALAHQAYEGTGRTDVTASGGLEAIWKLNRSAEIAAGYTHVWRSSTEAASNYQSDAVSLRLRLQH